jgi:uncharacterized protein (TIGR03435 family)
MRKLWIALALSLSALGQSFDVTSVKSIQAVAERKQRTFSITSTGVTFRNVNLREVIAAAYGLKPYQITGPLWLSGSDYEIIAKTATPASDAELKTMLQNLLADRFQMTTHRESKEQPVYTMTAVKTSMLHKPAREGEPRIGPARGGIAFQNYSMEKLADYLGGTPGINRPVLNMTGVEGEYDFTILIGEAANDPIEAKRAIESALIGDSFLGIVAAQLGLKIDSRKLPVQMLIIDRIERPSPN